MAQSANDSDRSNGSPRTRRRLRRILVLAALCLLLAVVVSSVWHYDRTLSPAEQRLVGTWRNTTGPNVFTFHADRRVTAPRYSGGKWFMQENRLYWYDSLLEEANMSLFHPEIDRSYVLTFEDDHNISVFVPVNGSTRKWQRIPEQQKSGDGSTASVARSVFVVDSFEPQRHNEHDAKK